MFINVLNIAKPEPNYNTVSGVFIVFNHLMPPAVNEYRWVRIKPAAMTGVANGTSQAITRATFTIPTAVADFVMLRIRYGILYGTIMDTA
jgi:hypothetical protein